MMYTPKRIVLPTPFHNYQCGDKNIYRVQVTTEDCEAFEKATFSMDRKKGQWGEGLISTATDRRKPQRLGIMGEMCFGAVFGLPVNLKEEKKGDKGDFSLLGDKGDIKTNGKGVGAALVKVLTDTERPVQWKHIRYYIAAYTEHDDAAAKENTTVLVGYTRIEDMLSLPVVRARKGYHYNVEIPWDSPICRPIDELLQLHEAYLLKHRDVA